MDKVLKLNSWSYLSLLGYAEIIIGLLIILLINTIPALVGVAVLFFMMFCNLAILSFLTTMLLPLFELHGDAELPRINKIHPIIVILGLLINLTLNVYVIYKFWQFIVTLPNAPV